MAGAGGFEPPVAEPKSAALPLGYAPSNRSVDPLRFTVKGAGGISCALYVVAAAVFGAGLLICCIVAELPYKRSAPAPPSRPID